MKPLDKTIYIGLLTLGIAIMIIGGYFFQPLAQAMPQSARATRQAAKLDTLGTPQHPARKTWVCPMHAHILQDHAGTCPICGMDLVEAESDSTSQGAGIRVDPATQQRLGVRLAKAAPHTLSREVHTYGTVTVDESSLFNVSPKIEGWIRKLHVSAVGQPVRAGQVLYELYSPELVQRQREYIELLQRRDQLLQNMTELSGQNAQVVASLARERMRTREKFAYADVSNEILNEIEKTRRTVDVVPVRAARSGFVTQIGAREGSFVTPMVNILSMANTAYVWIDVVLYPDQLAWVQEGNEVTVKPGTPGQPAIKGRLKFTSPITDGATQTVRARLVANNLQQRLRPGKFVDVVIAAQTHTTLAVPRSAVIRTGNGNRVMLARGDGHFLPIEVEIGIESGDLVEITDGLQEGAQVAVNGQFLLDAAASLSDAAQRMQGEH